MSASLPGIGRAVNSQRKICCLESGKVKHQRILRLTLLAATLLPINFVLKLDVLLPFERIAGEIFQNANIVPSLMKLLNPNWHVVNLQRTCCSRKNLKISDKIKSEG